MTPVITILIRRKSYGNTNTRHRFSQASPNSWIFPNQQKRMVERLRNWPLSQATKLGPRTTVWRAEEIKDFIENSGKGSLPWIMSCNPFLKCCMGMALRQKKSLPTAISTAARHWKSPESAMALISLTWTNPPPSGGATGKQASRKLIAPRKSNLFAFRVVCMAGTSEGHKTSTRSWTCQAPCRSRSTGQNGMESRIPMQSWTSIFAKKALPHWMAYVKTAITRCWFLFWTIAAQCKSLQRIYPDGSKRFLVGGKVQCGHFVIHGPQEKPIAICEGLATGASIHQATGWTVYVAFSAKQSSGCRLVRKKEIPGQHYNYLRRQWWNWPQTRWWSRQSGKCQICRACVHQRQWHGFQWLPPDGRIWNRPQAAWSGPEHATGPYGSGYGQIPVHENPDRGFFYRRSCRSRNRHSLRAKRRWQDICGLERGSCRCIWRRGVQLAGADAQKRPCLWMGKCLPLPCRRAFPQSLAACPLRHRLWKTCH